MRVSELTALSILLLGSCSRESVTLAPSITPMTAERHEPFFPIASGAHLGANCNACHGRFESFEEFTCLTCHSKATTAAQHAGLDPYVYRSQDCYDCHPLGEAILDHSPYFPIEAGSAHEGFSCGSCHVDPADRKVIDCLSCHPAARMAPVHSRVGGYQAQNSLCLRCHADSEVLRVAEHLPFDIAKGKHYLARCLLCHPRLRTDKPWGADFLPKNVDCLVCHLQSDMNSVHGGMRGYAYESLSCLAAGCHPDGKVP